MLVNFHGFGWSISIFDPQVLRALAAFLILLGLAWRLKQSQFIAAFFTFWFFLTLLPEQSFLPLSEPINGYRPYLAYAGLSIAIPHLVRAGFLALRTNAKLRIIAGKSRHWQTVSIAAAIMLMITLGLWTADRNRDWRDERTLWSDVLRKEPGNPRAHLGLGLDLLGHGEYAKAQAMFERALVLAPKNGYAHLIRGYLYQLSDQDERALKSLTTAVELNPRSTFALYYRGELLAKLGRFTEATADFERALILKHYFTDARHGLALAYLAQQNLTQGREHCELILKVDRRDFRAYRCLGRILMEQRDFENASRVFERGLRYLPSNKELWGDLSLTYRARGMPDAAAVALQNSTSAAGSLK